MSAPTNQSPLFELICALLDGEVQLTFKKVNGEVTTRLATLNRGLIPDEHFPVDRNGPFGKKEAAADCVMFYSLTDAGWRCFKPWNVVNFSVVNRLVEQELWITEWTAEKVKILDRLGNYAPVWVPREVIQEMTFESFSKMRQVYVYKALIDKSWWEGNVRYYQRSVTGYANERSGYRSDD